MSTTGRRKNISVVKQLTDNPYEFSFLQAVRLLERASVFKNNKQIKYNKNPVSKYTPPSTEVIRFKSNHALHFHSAELSQISTRKNNKNETQWEMLVNFIGINGSSGVLPYHYTELILQRLKIKDKSLAEFIDLFNHRLVSLFYQASNKYRLPIEYERSKLHKITKKANDPHTQLLLSLIGLGTDNLKNRLYTSDESLIFYSGLFSHSIKTTTALRQILSHHFNIPVQIKEFIGQWQELINDVRTRLPGKVIPQGQNNCLGRSVMIGRKGWFAQGKINIILGPLNKQQLDYFSPGNPSLKALHEIVKLYLGMEYAFDFIIKAKRKDIPKKIQLNNKAAPIIGWNTWLSSKLEKRFTHDETLDIHISGSHFN